MALLIQLPAGRWDWRAGWEMWAANAVITAIGGIWLSFSNPELLKRRARVGEGTPDWDRWQVLALIFSMVLLYILGGLDKGRSNSGPGPALWWAGLLTLNGGFLLLLWSMLVNTHFESTVRLQIDRGHRVVDRGPYAWIRHPGYSGGLTYFLGMCMMMGSAWSLFGWATAVCILAARLLLEEDFLTRSLEGYAEYRARVSYRLLPGIW